MRLILASASPRRLELLRQVGVDVDVLPCDLPEERAPGESPFGYSQRIARENTLSRDYGPVRAAQARLSEIEKARNSMEKNQKVDAATRARWLAKYDEQEAQVLESFRRRHGARR